MGGTIGASIGATYGGAAVTSKRGWPAVFPPLGRWSDAVTEADERYKNAGEKGHQHTDPADPPRRRANNARGHGTWESDRPPIAGVCGRSSGHIRLRVGHRSDRATLQPFVEAHTRDDATVNTDEWSAYGQVSQTGRLHQTVCHTPGQRE